MQLNSICLHIAIHDFENVIDLKLRLQIQFDLCD